MRITRESWLLGTICMADLIFTVWLLQRGTATEANPILRFYLNAGLPWFIAAKLLLFLGPLAALEIFRRRSPRFIPRLLQAGIALYILCYGVGVWNTNYSRVQAQVAPAWVMPESR